MNYRMLHKAYVTAHFEQAYAKRDDGGWIVYLDILDQYGCWAMTARGAWHRASDKVWSMRNKRVEKVTAAITE